MLSKTVLYAEDDENDRFFMKRAFAKMKLSDALVIVENGKTALDYLHGREPFRDRLQFPLPNLLILDVKMPFASGLEILREVRGMLGLEVLPVIMLTSSTQEKDLQEAHSLSANGYFVKPSNAERLFDLVSKLQEYWTEPTTRLIGRIDIVGNEIP